MSQVDVIHGQYAAASGDVHSFIDVAIGQSYNLPLH